MSKPENLKFRRQAARNKNKGRISLRDVKGMRKMKRFLLWIVGVAVGVGLFLAAAMGVSYYFTTESKLPQGAPAFAGAELTPNGYCWHVPLLGGMADKGFDQAETLTVQKLGVLTQAHPALELPGWTNYGTVRIFAADGTQVFSGTAGEYAEFAFPANGEYKAELQLWHLAPGMTAAAFYQLGGGAVLKNPGLETPAKPTGYFNYAFRFTLSAEPQVELSATSAGQGGVFGVWVSGIVSGGGPTAECDLGPVVFEQVSGGWRGYLPVAYNAEAGEHLLTVACGDQTVETRVRVTGRDFGRAEQAEPETEAGGTEFRNTIWPLYTAPSGGKAWQGRWSCPVEDYGTLVSYGQVKVVNGQAGGRSNSSLLLTRPGAEVYAPANGTVAYAGYLQLTGNTVVIDHGCGVRTYLYGLGEIYVNAGDAVLQNGVIALTGERLTLDVKIGNKSIDPWALFQASGGLFWRE